jgi:SAM-dependent methyltransferase
MGKLTKQQDAFGAAMYDRLLGKGGYEVDERDDGLVGILARPSAYLADYKDWPAHQKRAIALTRGRVLDIGCGAGRVCLHLQQKGFDVMGVDISPLAIKVCKLRGVKKAKVLSITEVTRKLGECDTILMYGNNFGLFGSFKRARWLLRRFHKMTAAQARIMAESNDPYQTKRRCHLIYQKCNRRRGRMSGQLRIRIRYLTHATPWFDYLLVSKDEMRAILTGTGWKITRFFDSNNSVYIAVLEKE